MWEARLHCEYPGSLALVFLDLGCQNGLEIELDMYQMGQIREFLKIDFQYIFTWIFKKSNLDSFCAN